MANRFTRGLTDLFPRTGRMIMEDGTSFNEADYLSLLQEYSLEYETIFNGAFVASYYQQIATFSPIFIGLSVPVGKQLILYDRILSLNNGTFLIEVGSGAFTGGTPLLLNALRTSANPVTLASTFNYGVTPSQTFVPREQLPYDAGGAGSGSQGGISEDSAFKIFDGGASGILRITRLAGTGTVYAGAQWLGWERDIPA